MQDLNLDDNTPPEYGHDYTAKAKARGLEARFALAEGACHGYQSLEATVLVVLAG